jgi:hypothetical protein
MTLDHNGTNGRVGTLDAQDVYIVRANVPVAVFGSTGLNSTAIGATAASTGAFTTLGATGDIISSSTGIIYANSTNNIPLRLESQTTGYSTLRITNTGGASFFGAEGSAGGTLVVGSTAYDTFIRAPSGIAFSANAGSAMQMRLSSTGLAVTGALSASGSTTLGGNGIGVTPAGTLNISDLNDSTVRLWRSTAEYIQFAAARGGFTGQNNVFLLDIVGNPNVRPFKIRQSSNGGSSFADIAEFSTSGLAVTGALSCTGALAIGNTVATAVSVASTHKVTIVIGGVTYYLLATNV